MDFTEQLVPRPSGGRVFSAARPVRLADASAGGRMRLDAVARYLQDVANDDARDAGSPNPTAWVARRTVISVDAFPHYLDRVVISTWCSGIGPRWAERRYSIEAPESGRGPIEAATLWVHVDLESMKPIGLPAGFAEQFGESAGGRKVSARLTLSADLPDLHGGNRSQHSWPLRFIDFDVLGHMNNTVYWAIVEEQLARLRHLRAPQIVVLEHHDAIDRDDEVDVICREDDSGADLWVVASGRLAARVSVR